jgi:hypothetical protein
LLSVTFAMARTKTTKTFKYAMEISKRSDGVCARRGCKGMVDAALENFAFCSVECFDKFNDCVVKAQRRHRTKEHNAKIRAEELRRKEAVVEL